MTIGEEPSNADKVQELQAALHAKAKESPNFRFYALYDKVYRRDILQAAYRQCRRNDGAAGVDRQEFDEVEAYGLEQRRQSGGCGFPNRTGSSGPSECPRSETASCKRRCD